MAQGLLAREGGGGDWLTSGRVYAVSLQRVWNHLRWGKPQEKEMGTERFFARKVSYCRVGFAYCCGLKGEGVGQGTQRCLCLRMRRIASFNRSAQGGKALGSW